MEISPYKGKAETEWLTITEELVEKHPLSTSEILEISLIAWDKLWTTKVGNIITLNEVELPATVVGYFFQKLFAHELSSRYKDKWIGEQNKADKDIVYINDTFYSIEMKSSGQMGYKIFGNRSYCQKSDNPSKAKSGYYITVNFNEQILNLISIGWIDQSDWKCQDAESGQAATLPPKIYEKKLIPIYGKYQLKSSIELLDGVGDKTLLKLIENKIFTFKDIINYSGEDTNIKRIKINNKDLLDAINT